MFHIHDSKTRHVRIFQGSPGPRGPPGEKGIQGLSGFKGNQVRKIPLIHDFLGSSEIYILLRQVIYLYQCTWHISCFRVRQVVKVIQQSQEGKELKE